MIPKTALQQLAAAIKSTPEYAQIIDLRKRIFADPHLGSLMQSFEREHTRIFRSDIKENESELYLKKLYADHQRFLEQEPIRDYIKATQKYHEMISGFMDYLNQLLSIGQGR